MLPTAVCSLSRAPIPLTVPRFIQASSRVRNETSDMLRSACYPCRGALCRHYGPDSTPGAFASRCGPYLDLCTVGCDSPFQALPCLRRAASSLTGPGWGYGSRLASLRRALGLLLGLQSPLSVSAPLVAAAPGQTVPPGKGVTWTVSHCVRQPWCPPSLHQASVGFSSGVDSIAEAHFPQATTAHLDYRSRDPAACFWLARCPVGASSTHPWGSLLWM